MTTQDFELYTDASGSWGAGSCFAGAWFAIPWAPHQCLRPIHWKDLFTILAAALTWAHKLLGHRVCNNLEVVNAWQNKPAKDCPLLILLWKLFFVAAQHNFTVSLAHLPGKCNACTNSCHITSSHISFFLSPQANALPTMPP